MYNLRKTKRYLINPRCHLLFDQEDLRKNRFHLRLIKYRLFFFADIICFFEAPVSLEAVWAWKKESIVGVYNLRKTKRYLINQVPSAFHAQHAHPTSPRSTGFCAIWDCISSNLSSTWFLTKRTCEKAGGTSGLSSIVFFAYNVCLFEDYICFSADCALRSPWKRWGSGKNRASLLCAICEKANDT